MSPATMRVILALCLLGEALLAVFFLCQRRMSFYAYLGWGLLALLIPVIGPFLVIWVCPGESLEPHRIRKINRRLQNARERILDQLL
jgi:hypothetical protein